MTAPTRRLGWGWLRDGFGRQKTDFRRGWHGSPTSTEPGAPLKKMLPRDVMPLGYVGHTRPVNPDLCQDL
ncbi:hypothetical protein AA0535_2165 [Asaia krungthepensis NRIC 0535]|uniref:Uncharacterized protein n=1 Tax=Asaia krungthepensis NRIC 0535 TaxID=1307925 RepID=A0ABQ0Q4F2_9PROT|nr:hypothetical protein AA0535_2165 [Asaia krungthepensis NRIC 0535]